MSSWRRLAGLPAEGLPAISIPANWGQLGREGLVVEFLDDGGSSWAANFKPGIGGANGVWGHPDGRHAIVVASGDAWLVDPSSRAATSYSFVPAIFAMWPLTK